MELAKSLPIGLREGVIYRENTTMVSIGMLFALTNLFPCQLVAILFVDVFGLKSDTTERRF